MNYPKISLNSTTAIVNSVKDTIEELTELLGESIALFGLTLFFLTQLQADSIGDKGTRGRGDEEKR
ncbi:hypothetical protein IQ264_19255 [Phormidium sp. LEGE 05292]|uniref:hypothetical protein n=1 Tax=[Phormidium] sp. LEGE 05292 TaxID=767427 RepID=UPI00187EAB62|nr:hypothetical protein [Phormidium sp. LEGE 05292]MBE9227571.1 hypothetical protein [Phormidium sp. LEGE 05292]